MWIGYLQLGPTEHGICRYGKLLAKEGDRRRSNHNIIEVTITLTENRKRNREMLISAARQLSAAEIIHIQYSCKNNRPLWGSRWEQLYYLWIFKHYCSRPIVVTVHDIYEPPLSANTVLSQVYQKLQNITSSLNPNKETSATSKERPEAASNLPLSKVIQRSIYGANALTLRWLLDRAKLVFVCSYEEEKRLKAIIDVNKIKVVRHFVEQRNLSSDRAEAKAALNLDKGKIITILGFIHSRKGYQLMIEAMPKLPQDVKVVFAGGPSPGNEEFVQELIQLAKAKGIGDRLRITGYLSEAELEQYLIATDLGVCPFKFFSASSSLSNWISATRPILAYDLPQIAEYNLLQPGAIKTFHPYDPDAFAQAIEQLLLTITQQDDSKIVNLRNQLSISAIFDEQLNYYHQVTKTPSGTLSKQEALKY